MAAFNHPFLFDSVFSPRITAFSEEPDTITNITTTPYIYQNYPADTLQNIYPVVNGVVAPKAQSSFANYE
ncbi:hypothetical protein LguiA_005051 [Lonicera macranthoides]